MKLKKDILKIIITFIILVVIIKIVFFKEEILVVLMVGLTILYLFIIPGYFIMLYWGDKFDFKERIIIGSCASVALLGLSCYFLGLLGINIFIWSKIYPLATILITSMIIFKRKC